MKRFASVFSILGVAVLVAAEQPKPHAPERLNSKKQYQCCYARMSVLECRGPDPESEEDDWECYPLGTNDWVWVKHPVDPGFAGWSGYLWETFPVSVATCDAYEPTGCGTPEEKCDYPFTKTTFTCESFPQPTGVAKDCTG